MKIIDNFLDTETHENIKKIMLSNDFPWYITGIIEEIDSHLDGKEFMHMFYNNDAPNSSYWKMLQPILQKIDFNSMVRVRAALMPYNGMQEEKGWHKDFDFNCTTAIYYVNSNNGYTKFEDGSIVESVANRFVSFNSQLMHTGARSTDNQFRCLINFNYF